MHPAGISRTDDRLGGRTNDEWFGQFAGRNELAVFFLQPVIGDHRALLGKSFHVLGLFLEEAERDEEGKVGVDVTRRLEHRVELALHIFPDPPAPRLDDHAAADVGIFGQVGSFDHMLIPLGKIVGAGRGDGGRHGKLRLEG